VDTAQSFSALLAARRSTKHLSHLGAHPWRNIHLDGSRRWWGKYGSDKKFQMLQIVVDSVILFIAS
jgi:hypothetical protein